MSATLSIPSIEALYPPTVTPAPRPLPLWRFLPLFVRNPLRALPRQVYEEPLVVSAGRRSGIVWVTDPGLVERILLRDHEDFPKTPLEQRVLKETLGHGILTSQGQSWRWQRRIAAPLFRHQELVGYIPTMVAATASLIDRWAQSPAAGQRPIERDMTDVTYDVITRTILAGADPAEGDVIKSAGARYLASISWEIAAGILRLPDWVWHPGKPSMRPAARELRAAVARIIVRRRAGQHPDADDLLARLLAARDPDTGAPMSDQQLVDNVLTFLTAGHETTAKALTWTLYLLARSPYWQAAVREEVRAVAGSAEVGPDDLERLTVTQMVLKEAMRLYPPAPVMSRMVGRDLELGGRRLGKGTTIMIPIYAIHRHRRLWSDPDRFDPTRFSAEAQARQLRTQFMPFGYGPRSCIGMAFAMIEATVLLATLVRAAAFEWDGRHAPEPLSRVTLRPKGGMPLAVRLL